MTVELSDRELVTEECRLAFPALFEPKPRFKGSEKVTYQAVVLIPPDTDLKPFVNAIKAAMLEKWGKLIQLPASKNPLHDCSEKPDMGGYEPGWRYINTHSGFQPGLVNQKRQQVLDPETFYPGCWCRFLLSAYAWDHPSGGKGVSFSLGAVQFARNDDRLDNRRDAAQVFGEIEFDDEDEAPAPQVDVDDLFG